MRNIINITLLLLGLAAIASAADARTCTTQCYNYGNMRQCSTTCY